MAFGIFFALHADFMPIAPEPFHTRGFRFACKAVLLYLEVRKRPEVPDFIGRQFVRSATSVGAQLEEARAAQSRRDSALKFSIALKEARESAYWLRLLTRTGLVPEPITRALTSEALELVAILTVARRKLNRPAE